MSKTPLEWPPTRLPKDFPLTIHQRGYVKSGIGWICGKKTPAEALAIYHEKAQAKLQRRAPKVIRYAVGDEQAVEQLAERYTAVRLRDANRGDISLSAYRRIELAVARFLLHSISESVPGIGGTTIKATRYCDLIPDHFSDFGDAMKDQGGEAFARQQCRWVAGLFHHAAEENWVDRPVKFGKRFKKIAWSKPTPFKSVPPTAAEVKTMLGFIDAHLAKHEGKKSKRNNVFDLRAWRQFKAGMLLALNGGYGSTELAELPRNLVDLDVGVIDYRRGKTKQDHIVPLWPETIGALREVFADLDRTRAGDDLVFRTREGQPWAHESPKQDEDGGPGHVNVNDNFGQWFSRIARKCKIKRAFQSFYSLKDLHCSIADEHLDQPAAYRLTGHRYHTGGRDPYVTVTIERLRKVVDFIRQRVLLGVPAGGPPSASTEVTSPTAPTSPAAE